MNCIGCYLNELWRKVMGASSNPSPVPPSPEVSRSVEEEQATGGSTQTPSPLVETVEGEGRLERLPGDDPLNNTAWVKLAGACVELFAELDRYQADFDPPRREVAEHVCNRLREILARNGVDLIDADGAFDCNLHEPDPAGIRPKPGAATARVISPGFQIGRRVLRRARVEIVQEPSTPGE